MSKAHLNACLFCLKFLSDFANGFEVPRLKGVRGVVGGGVRLMTIYETAIHLSMKKRKMMADENSLESLYSDKTNLLLHVKWYFLTINN